MPTYEYRCTVCGHEDERFQSITDRPLRTCPACGRRTLQRLIGAGGGLIFKGSGFYITDYRSESYKKAAKTEQKQPAGDNASQPARKSPAPSAAAKNEKPAAKSPPAT